MTRFSLPIPSLIAGVSQQSPNLRLSGQAELQDNLYPSPTDGLTPRHPVDHLAHLDDADLGDALVHVINRSPGEQYVALFGGEPGSEFARVFEASDGTEVPVFGPRSLGPPFTPDFTYLTSPSPFRPANRDLKALTLVDYTLVLNKNVGVELEQTQSDPDPSKSTGFLFVREGQYSTEYKATIKTPGEDPTVFKVTTWDGISAGTSTAEEWELTITAAGTAGTDWRVTAGNGFGDDVAEYTVQGGDTPSLVASGLATAINALDDVSASAVGAVVTITSTLQGLHFVPGVRPATGGTFTLEQTNTGDTSEILTSIETNDIAETLALQIAADPRFTVETVGSVIRIDANDVTNTEEIWRLTITRKSGAGTEWEVGVLAQTASYTVQSGDTIQDIAQGLGAAIDALTSVSATVSNATITLVSTSEMSPAVAPGAGGTYTLTEVADVGTTVGRFESIKAEDSRGNNALLAVWYSVDATDLLPLVLSDGFIVRVDGGTDDTADDSYVKFVADTPGEFGKGHWVETLGFELFTSLDPASMPHALIRREDDTLGTVTGTPFAKYFEWTPNEWEQRVVGDEDTAPHPSVATFEIADSLEDTPVPLSDIFFFKNRLGLVSGQKVVMSEVGRYFNLWRTTVLDLVDSDPIDILIPHHTAVSVAHAQAYNQTLVLFADRVAFKLDGEPTLTPKTVQTPPILEYEVDRKAPPLTTEHGIYFAAQRGDFSGVRELVPDRQVVGQFSVEDIGIAVPQYVSGRVIQQAALDQEGALFVLADGDQSKLYLYKSFRSDGRHLQAAWCRYDFGENARVLGMGFIGPALYLVVNRPDGTSLESTRVLSDSVDDGALYLTHLDRRVTDLDSAYDPDSDTTSWQLPYEGDDDEVYVAVTVSSAGNDGGTVIPLTVVGNVATAVTLGDFTLEDVWIGQVFTWRFRFSPLIVKPRGADGGQRVEGGGRLQVYHGVLLIANTAALSVEVTPYRRSMRTAVFNPATAPKVRVVDGNLPLATGVFRFPVYAKDAVIDITGTGPLPAAIQSAEFEVQRTGIFPARG